MSKNFFLKSILIIIFFFSLSPNSAKAIDLTSTNFIIRDPVVGTGGGYGTSASFKLFSTGHDSFSDVNDSLSFIGHYGFLYFPFFSSGNLTATPSGSDVNLSWTSSSAGLGWSVGGYRTGISNVSGGPYTYTNVGLVNNYSYTSLTAGSYCFIVETLDALGNIIGRSNESCTTVSGGGGATGGRIIFQTGVRFTGQAFPFSIVSLLKGGQEVEKVQASSQGYFNLNFPESVAGNVIYTVFATDIDGTKSLIINYPVLIRIGSVAYLDEVLFAPTISTDKSVVKSGNYLQVFGYSILNREIEVVIEDGRRSVFTTFSDENGFYEISIPTEGLLKGEYKVYVKYSDDIRISKLIKFSVGEADVFNRETTSLIPGDCNKDRIINLIDFSILAFWYNKPNPPACVDTNSDGTINLVDFSILAFYWTG